MREIPRSIIGAITEHDMLPRGGLIAAGVSGGADSLCLLHVLLRLRGEYGFELKAVHVNHGIRGGEADGDEAFVGRLCRGLGVPLDIYRYDVPAEAARRRLTVEEAGRALRYESFEKSLGGGAPGKVAVAHNQNDSAETVIMRIFRGTGMKGLAGIPAVRGNIIRPLINTPRAEIESYCAENGIDFRTDSTNLESVYTRNFIRLELLPLVEKRLAPAAPASVSRMAKIVSEEDAYLDGLAAGALEACLTPPSGLSAEKLTEFPEVLRRRALRLFLLPYTGDNHDVSYAHISAALALLDKKTGSSVNLPRGLRLSLSYGELAVTGARGGGEENALGTYALPLDTTVFIRERGLYVRASRKKPDNSFPNVCTKTFSYDKMKDVLKIRGRRPGDRIYCAGMGGNKKIKDYLIDTKTPRAERGLTPLLVCGGDVVWIMDRRNIVSDSYKTDGAGENAVYIQKWEEQRDNERNY